ncbi:hypothetical protein ACN24K_35330 [Streptomyces microflavus]
MVIDAPLSRIPVLARAGAVVPVRDADGELELEVWAPAPGRTGAGWWSGTRVTGGPRPRWSGMWRGGRASGSWWSGKVRRGRRRSGFRCGCGGGGVAGLFGSAVRLGWRGSWGEARYAGVAGRSGEAPYAGVGVAG